MKLIYFIYSVMCNYVLLFLHLNSMGKAWHVNNTTEEIWLHATWNVCTYLVLFMIFICKGECKKKHKKANTQTYGAQRTKKKKQPTMKGNKIIKLI